MRWMLVLLLVAGCGGDDDPPAPDARPSASDAAAPDVAVAPDTWESFAQGFFQSYCVECHAAGGARDYTTIDHVMRDAATIRCGVSPVMLDGCGAFPPPGQFPVGDGPFPGDEERTRLVVWIESL